MQEALDFQGAETMLKVLSSHGEEIVAMHNTLNGHMNTNVHATINNPKIIVTHIV